MSGVNRIFFLPFTGIQLVVHDKSDPNVIPPSLTFFSFAPGGIKGIALISLFPPFFSGRSLELPGETESKLYAPSFLDACFLSGGCGEWAIGDCAYIWSALSDAVVLVLPEQVLLVPSRPLIFFCAKKNGSSDCPNEEPGPSPFSVKRGRF